MQITKRLKKALVMFETVCDEMDAESSDYCTTVNEVCKLMASFIRSNNLTPEDVNEIYRAIVAGDCVLGSKLWTDRDIKMALDDDFGGIGEILDENAQCEMANNVDSDVLNDCDDAEWNAIISGIENSGVFVRGKGVEWGICEEDCDLTEECNKILNELPRDVEIPIENFKNCNNYVDYISDYISDEYGWCYKSCESVELTTEPIQVTGTQAIGTVTYC